MNKENLLQSDFFEEFDKKKNEEMQKLKDDATGEAFEKMRAAADGKIEVAEVKPPPRPLFPYERKLIAEERAARNKKNMTKTKPQLNAWRATGASKSAEAIARKEDELDEKSHGDN